MAAQADEMWVELKEELEGSLEELSSSRTENQDIYLLMVELLKTCKIKEREDT